MAESITGNVTGKVGFKIDQQSWKNLDKFKRELTSLKRQMGSLDKSIKVQAVVKQMTEVQRKVASGSIKEKQREMNAHVAAKQKHDTVVSRLYDKALAEDRRREDAKIKAYEKSNARLLAADKKLDVDRAKMFDRASSMNNRFDTNRGRFSSRANMYTQVKMQQARIAGVDQSGLDRIQQRAAQAMSTSGGDIAVFRHQLQQTTKDLIANTREINKNKITLRSLRTDLVQITAAYTAFSGVVNIAQTGMEINL